SQEAYMAVEDVSTLLFTKKASTEQLFSIGLPSYEAISKEIPSYAFTAAQWTSSITVLDLLTEMTDICVSKGEARRAIKNNAISINKTKIQDPEIVINLDQLIHGCYLLLENGKKNKYLLKLEGEQ
ncbi:MAG: tyrosine--tRNA ligase, partial [Bacteroidota bacterium]